MKTYHFIIVGGVIVGYLDYEPAEIEESPFEEIVRLQTDIAPEKYFGLKKTEMEDDPLRIPIEKDAYKNTQEWRRAELKRLNLEIEFMNKIEENSATLQTEFELLLIEYNADK